MLDMLNFNFISNLYDATWFKFIFNSMSLLTIHMLDGGDIIATPIAKVLQLFTGKIALHVAIYLGDGRVSHVSGHGGGKAAGVARIGRLLGDFTTKGTETIWLLNLLLRIRSGEEIAKKAEEFAANEFRKGDYNVFLRNCQHFVALCATGGEFAFNI
ncbi:hypothetical protein B9Z55_020935 [Caenorhabditis nigoni]|uniref:LRAT domain-containing protein n=1 Tax=Caenorhabditis nigoni TaxID=1611254 RepID=A0A2G5TPZ0_9PELO|nr:hypothetical protein B9Z55_020935 [Caenorhabditis nigoni]